MLTARNILIATGTLVFIVLLAALLYTGHNSQSNIVEQSLPSPASIASETKQLNMETTIILKSQNNSFQTGSVNIKEENGKIAVTVNIKKGPANIPQPAHIHAGSCENLGEIKYPLASIVDGFSQTEINSTLEDLKASLPLAVNVHKSSEAAKTYVACANIEFRPATSEATPSLDQP